MAKTGQTGLHRYRSFLLKALRRDHKALKGDAPDAESPASDSSETATAPGAISPEATPMRRAEDREIYGSDPYLSSLTRANKDSV